jgi:hypothetical protein
MPDRGTPGKPSSSEEEYFVREDAEKKRKLALAAKKDKAAAELKALKDLHFMKCPKCGLDLHEVKYAGLDVDVCFACHGVFLDRGELETILKNTKPGVMLSILNWFKQETGAP